jgi:hypothetical protein
MDDKVASGIAYLKGVNDTFQDQIKTADQKATYILTLIILMLVWTPDVKRLFLAVEEPVGTLLIRAVSLVVTLSLTVALLSALAVVLPRHRRGGQPLFWGAWPEAKVEAIHLATEADEARLIESYANNAQNLAAICRSKYRLVRISIWSLIVAVAAHGVFLALR